MNTVKNMVVTWEELQGYDMSTVDVKLGRSASVENEYSKLSKAERERKIASIKKKVNENQILLTKNDFPYNVEEDIQHYVMWTSGNQSLTQTKQYVSSLPGMKGFDIVVFSNSTSARSILDIDHHHVFIREKTKQNYKTFHFPVLE